MSEYQHKPLLEQICQHLDGWQVEDSEGLSWACYLVHTSGARVQVSGEDKLTFFPLTARFENHSRDFSSLPRVAISGKKPTARIATELQRRLLGEFLLAYEKTMTNMQAIYAEEVEAIAFMAQFKPLFPDCTIDSQPSLSYCLPDLYEKIWCNPDSQWSGVTHLTAELSVHCKEGWDIKISGYGKKALANLLKKIAITQPQPDCGS